jgi:hypothetical protein
MESFETIASYSPTAASRLREEVEKLGLEIITEHVALPYGVFFEAVPSEHMAFLESLKTFCRTPDAVCVHGGLKPEGGPVEEQSSEDLIWGTREFPEQYRGEEFVLYGHADQPVLDEKGWPHPRIVGRTYGLDTISKGVLTAVRLPDGAVFQSQRFERAQKSNLVMGFKLEKAR